MNKQHAHRQTASTNTFVCEIELNALLLFHPHHKTNQSESCASFGAVFLCPYPGASWIPSSECGVLMPRRIIIALSYLVQFRARRNVLAIVGRCVFLKMRISPTFAHVGLRESAIVTSYRILSLSLQYIVIKFQTFAFNQKHKHIIEKSNEYNKHPLQDIAAQIFPVESMPVFRHPKKNCDVFFPTLSWLSSASFPRISFLALFLL